MKVISVFRAASVVALACAGVSADAITYTANRAVGNGTVALSLTTDGTIGTLATANVVDWTITVAQGANSFTLLPGNSESLISGDGVSATANAILFDFDGSGFWLIQTPSIGSAQPFWCVQFAGCFDFAGPAEGILAQFNNFSSFTREAYRGVQVIASSGVSSGVIPEPATWAMMIAGFGLVGAGLRRQRALASA